MAEPTVQVPVSLIEQFLGQHGQVTEPMIDEFRALLSQPTSTAEPDRWSDGWKAAVAYFQIDAEAFHERNAAEPPRIEDMAPGTTFNCPERWTVGPPTLQGRQWAYRAGEGRYLDEFDPSTIRDVTPPA